MKWLNSALLTIRPFKSEEVVRPEVELKKKSLAEEISPYFFSTAS